MTFFKTITFRLTIWYLAIFALLSGALGAGIYLSLSSTFRNNIDSDLIARSEQLSQFNDIISIIANTDNASIIRHWRGVFGRQGIKAC